MGVSHRYRLLSVRGPRMVMRARRGAASRLSLALASALHDASSSRSAAFGSTCAVCALSDVCKR